MVDGDGDMKAGGGGRGSGEWDGDGFLKQASECRVKLLCLLSFFLIHRACMVREFLCWSGVKDKTWETRTEEESGRYWLREQVWGGGVGGMIVCFVGSIRSVSCIRFLSPLLLSVVDCRSCLDPWLSRTSFGQPCI